ncbi:MAG: B12-binding domain-containing protein [Hyphomicrobium sp.]
MSNRGAREAELGQGAQDWFASPYLDEALSDRFIRSPVEKTSEAILSSIIENDIIPRLFRVSSIKQKLAPPVPQFTTEKLSSYVDEFAELVIKRDSQGALNYFQKLSDEGASVNILFSNLLAPTAKRLGELWLEDIYDFLDVTRGVGHMQEIVRMFGSDKNLNHHAPVSGRQVLLTPFPGEQHTFGISLLRESFLSQGWQVWCGPPKSFDDILEMVCNNSFDLLGLSSTVVSDAAKVTSEIERIRKGAKNKDMQIYVGGYAFLQNPELVKKLGADGTASDARMAVELMTKRMSITKQ